MAISEFFPHSLCGWAKSDNEKYWFIAVKQIMKWFQLCKRYARKQVKYRETTQTRTIGNVKNGWIGKTLKMDVFWIAIRIHFNLIKCIILKPSKLMKFISTLYKKCCWKSTFMRRYQFKLIDTWILGFDNSIIQTNWKFPVCWEPNLV